MSGVINFVSGKTLEITEREFRNLAPKLKTGGIRLVMTSAGDYIPLNSNTMEYIQHAPEPEEELPKPAPKVVKKPKVVEPELEPTKDVEEKKKSAMDEFLEKSSCKHEPDKLKLFTQQTAKGVRYFPVCTFCGKRERYISEAKIIDGKYEGTANARWTKDDIDSAIEYTGS